MSDLEHQIVNTSETIDRYCQAWSEPDPIRRSELLAVVWAANATYMDPTVHLEGVQALLTHIGKVQAGRPGARVVRTTNLDEHHSIARFGFRVTGTDGAILREGMDVAFMAADGTRIERIIGFFGLLMNGPK